ncbi:MAG TPA: DUF4397 domain-containing protein [Terriglobales bacterium]|nr:DUF4397 domain-containing protein [Terriglobales bacterium]
MNFRTRVVLQLAALCLALGASAFAANDGYLYIVHGIPGRDIADNLNPGLPVDILVSGDCLVRGLTFGNTAGPFSFSAGTYDVQISLANSLAPCTSAPMIDSQVTLTAAASMSAVAAISGGQPALLDFTDNLKPITPGNARFVFANSADAPTLQATLTQLFVKNPKTYTVTANPGAQNAISVPAGAYLVRVVAVGSTTVLASEQIDLADQSATFTYAAGEEVNNSVGLINRAVRDVF